MATAKKDKHVLPSSLQGTPNHHTDEKKKKRNSFSHDDLNVVKKEKRRSHSPNPPESAPSKTTKEDHPKRFKLRSPRTPKPKDKPDPIKKATTLDLLNTASKLHEPAPRPLVSFEGGEHEMRTPKSPFSPPGRMMESLRRSKGSAEGFLQVSPEKPSFRHSEKPRKREDKDTLPRTKEDDTKPPEREHKLLKSKSTTKVNFMDDVPRFVAFVNKEGEDAENNVEGIHSTRSGRATSRSFSTRFAQKTSPRKPHIRQSSDSRPFDVKNSESKPDPSPKPPDTRPPESKHPDTKLNDSKPGEVIPSDIRNTSNEGDRKLTTSAKSKISRMRSSSKRISMKVDKLFDSTKPVMLNVEETLEQVPFHYSEEDLQNVSFFTKIGFLLKQELKQFMNTISNLITTMETLNISPHLATNSVDDLRPSFKKLKKSAKKIVKYFNEASQNMHITDPTNQIFLTPLQSERKIHTHKSIPISKAFSYRLIFHYISESLVSDYQRLCSASVGLLSFLIEMESDKELHSIYLSSMFNGMIHIFQVMLDHINTYLNVEVELKSQTAPIDKPTYQSTKKDEQLNTLNDKVVHTPSSTPMAAQSRAAITRAKSQPSPAVQKVVRHSSSIVPAPTIVPLPNSQSVGRISQIPLNTLNNTNEEKLPSKPNTSRPVPSDTLEAKGRLRSNTLPSSSVLSQSVVSNLMKSHSLKAPARPSHQKSELHFSSTPEANEQQQPTDIPHHHDSHLHQPPQTTALSPRPSPTVQFHTSQILHPSHPMQSSSQPQPNQSPQPLHPSQSSQPSQPPPSLSSQSRSSRQSSSQSSQCSPHDSQTSVLNEEADTIIVEIDFNEEEETPISFSLVQLVCYLTSPMVSPPHTFKSCFLFTLESFCNPRELWTLIKDRFNGKYALKQSSKGNDKVEDAKVMKEEREEVQRLCALLLLQWLRKDIHVVDFHSEILQFAKLCKTNPKLDNIGSSLAKLLDEHQFDKKRHHLEEIGIPTYSVSCFSSPYDIVLHFSNMDIALQLTLWDINIYKSIQPEEIFGQKWSKESTRLLSYNVCRMIQRTNEISQWVATSILIADKSKRIEVFQNMIGIASCLLEIGNFQSFMSIAMAFESIPISRLKLADSVLKKKYQQELAKFQELQSPLNKFRKLREAMNEKSIHIPYLAVVLLDYTAIDENCPQLVEAPTGEKFLNFYKFQQVDRILFQFFATKKLIGPTGLFGNFKLEEQHPLYEFVSVLPGFDTDFLYFLSLSREPKHPNNLN